MQQSYENQLSFNQVEVLNIFYEEEKELLLSFTLEKILAVDIVNGIAVTAVIGDKMDSIFGCR